MKRVFAFLIVLTLLLCAAGCQKTPQAEATDTVVAAMDTQMNLRLYGDTDNAGARALSAEILRLNGIFSVTDETSELYALNRFKVSSDADLYALMQQAEEIGSRTDGALDVTLLPLSRLWGFIGAAYYVPTDEEITETMQSVGKNNYTLDGARIVLESDAELDFGALAKGYAADRCRAIMEDMNMTGLLSLGGNIQSVGTKPDGSAWIIGVQDPQQPDKSLLTLSVTGTKSIVTSGDYQRFFDYDGVHYCHIIDPQTGSPVQNTLRSVTIVADSGMLADGLSTALFVMGMEKAADFWRQSNDFEAVFIDHNGAVYVTQGLTEAVSDCEYTVIER